MPPPDRAPLACAHATTTWPGSGGACGHGRQWLSAGHSSSAAQKPVLHVGRGWAEAGVAAHQRRQDAQPWRRLRLD